VYSPKRWISKIQLCNSVDAIIYHNPITRTRSVRLLTPADLQMLELEAILQSSQEELIDTIQPKFEGARKRARALTYEVVDLKYDLNKKTVAWKQKWGIEEYDREIDALRAENALLRKRLKEKEYTVVDMEKNSATSGAKRQRLTS
jgi:hypothetical protein